MIKSLAKNKTELHIRGMIVLYSYSTPVAVYIPNQGYFVTNTYYTKTTTRHINSWVGSNPKTLIDQSQLNQLVG